MKDTTCSPSKTSKLALISVCVATLGGCKTMPELSASLAQPARLLAPPPSAIATQPPAPQAPAARESSCKQLRTDAPTRGEVIGTTALAGMVTGAAIGSRSARNDRIGTRNGALLGLIAGAIGGTLYANQMKVAEQPDGSVKLDIPGRVLFPSNSADVSPEFRSTLERVARTITEYCDLSARIVGHTDNVGPVSYNEMLSFRRASAVKTALKTMGVDRDIVIDGRGPHEPIAPNATEEGRATNRRVELFFVPPRT